jgi:hypothetical protein
VQAVVDERILPAILEVLAVPMTQKYGCPMVALWRRGVHTFVSVVHAAVRGGSLHASLKSADPVRLAALHHLTPHFSTSRCTEKT